MSIKVRNVSPFGELDAPFIGLIERDEVVEVAEEHAALLLVQPFHYAPGDKAAEAFLASLTPPSEESDEEPESPTVPEANEEAQP